MTKAWPWLCWPLGLVDLALLPELPANPRTHGHVDKPQARLAANVAT